MFAGETASKCEAEYHLSYFRYRMWGICELIKLFKKVTSIMHPSPQLQSAHDEVLVSVPAEFLQSAQGASRTPAAGDQRPQGRRRGCAGS